MATIEIKNQDLAEKKTIPQPIIKATIETKEEVAEVVYPNENAKELCIKLNPYGNEELDKVLIAFNKEKQAGRSSVTVKGDLSDKTQQTLFQIGFKLKKAYEEKPKYAQNANTETIDVNKPFYTITFE